MEANRKWDNIQQGLPRVNHASLICYLDDQFIYQRKLRSTTSMHYSHCLSGQWIKCYLGNHSSRWELIGTDQGNVSSREGLKGRFWNSSSRRLGNHWQYRKDVMSQWGTDGKSRGGWNLVDVSVNSWCNNRVSTMKQVFDSWEWLRRRTLLWLLWEQKAWDPLPCHDL